MWEDEWHLEIANTTCVHDIRGCTVFCNELIRGPLSTVFAMHACGSENLLGVGPLVSRPMFLCMLYCIAAFLSICHVFAFPHTPYEPLLATAARLHFLN